MRVAVIDIGTNSTRLLIAESKQNNIEILKFGLITTRLGEGIGKEPLLLKPAIERTINALSQYFRLIKDFRVKKVVVAATSAVRDASNSEDFILEVKNHFGWQVQVLSGNEEAEMSYVGAIRGLKKPVTDPVVIDIGGGSTEFIWRKNGVLSFISKRVGAVRMTESCSNLTDIRNLLNGLLTSISIDGFVDLIGVGGTITTLAAIDQKLDTYDSAKVHGYFLTHDSIEQILNRLENLTLEERKKVPGLQPERADIILAGTKILYTIVTGLRAKGITVSETDIMYGLLYRALGV